ncbi:MAG: undecaprenyl-diphosphate phosphatase [Betaproteobacteria bacterium]|nr:undecaprenyl-diphosphate phosphatase [Betaproteobacteria bacterium]
MDVTPYLHAFILGVVEGLTEFLPVSSTGHLIIVGSLLNFNDEKGKVFELVIQTGAMLAVCWEFRARFRGVLCGLTTDVGAQRFVLNLIAAFMPAAVIGLALGGIIKSHLFHAVPVAMALIIGGFVILWAERRDRAARIDDVDMMTWRDALKVGFAQAFALFPGVSRAGATIIGGMLFGLSRRAATEFSFFLAVPTLMAAGAYDLYKSRALLSADDIGLFGVGTVTAFVSAFVCIRWLIRYVASHDFRIFAWYRIGFGLFILLSAYTGVISW